MRRMCCERMHRKPGPLDEGVTKTKAAAIRLSRAPSPGNRLMQSLLSCGALKFDGGNRRVPPQFYQKPEKGGKAENKPATPELKRVETPYADCTPKPATLQEVQAVHPNVTGVTDATASSGGLELRYKDGFCQTKVTSDPTLTFGNFLYTKPGTYPLGKDPGTDRCRGKTVDAFLHIVPDVADRIWQAEVEHCNDMHRAFKLTFQAGFRTLHSLESPGIRDKPEHCGEAISAAVKTAIGVEPSKLVESYNCLYDLSKTRDDNKWHTVDRGKPVYDAGCQSVTYTPDPKTVLPEVGQHLSEDIVKGCNIKP